MSEDADRLQRWASAERTLGRSRALARAAGKLPERLGWLLRAIAALDEGSPDGVRGLADEAQAAGEAEIAAILRVALAAPDDLDPTGLRRDAKRAGLGAGMTLPYLDLLRLFAARRAGAQTNRSAAIRQLEGERLLLYSVGQAMSTTAARVEWSPALNAVFPRAMQVIVAARVFEEGGHISAAYLERHFGEALVELDPERWPDISARCAGASLDHWIAHGGEWPPDMEPPAGARRQRAALAGVLHRIHAELERGQVVGLAEPGNFACYLADQLGLSKLQEHIHRLHLRLEWLDQGALPLELVEALLQQPRPASELAALGESAFEGRLTSPVAIRAILAWIVRLDDLDEAGEHLGKLLARSGELDISAAQLARACEDAGADAFRRRALEGIRLIEHGQGVQGLRLLAALLPEAPEPAMLGRWAHYAADMMALDEREERESLDGFLVAYAEHVSDLGQWEELLVLPMDLGVGYTWPEAFQERLAETLVTLQPASLPPREQAVALGMSVAAARADLTAGFVKQIGRALVRQPRRVLTIRQGLLLLGHLCDEQQLVPDEQLDSLSRLVFTQPREDITQALGELGLDAPTEGIVRWWNRRPELGVHPPALRALVERTVFSDTEPGPRREAQIDSFLDDPDSEPEFYVGPDGFPGMMGGLLDEMESLGGGPSEFRRMIERLIGMGLD